MSVGRCLHHSLEIAKRPRGQWADRIAELPETCPHDDCGAPKNCRERNAEYLRMQWQIQERRDAIAAEKAETAAR